MTKVKYDVTGSDPDRAATGGGGKINPGRYHGKVQKVLLKKGRDPDTGEPSKDFPMLDIETKLLEADSKKNSKMKGRTIRDFPMLPDHPSYEGMEWKLDRWLLASGIATKKKRRGTFDTDDIEDTDVILTIRQQRNDPERTEVGGVEPFDEDAWEESKSSGSDDEDEDISDDDLEDIDDDEDEDIDYSEWSLDELKEELDEREIDYTAKVTKKKAISLLEDDDESPESDDEDEEEDEDDDDDQELDYSEWKVSDLKEELDEREIEYPDSAKKAKLVKLLEESDAGDEDEDDEDEEEEEPEPPKKSKKSKPVKSKSKTKKKGKKSDDDDEDFPFK